MRRKKLMYIGVMVLVAVILVFFLSVILCGGFTFSGCRSSSDKNKALLLQEFLALGEKQP